MKILFYNARYFYFYMHATNQLMLLGIAIETMHILYIIDLNLLDLCFLHRVLGAIVEVFQLVTLALAKLHLVARALTSVLVAAGIIQMILVVGASTDTS